MAIAPSMSMRQLASILDSMVGIIAVDPEGRVVLFNEQAAAIVGRPVKDALGRDVREVVPNTRLPHVLASGQDELNQRQELGSTAIITSRMVVRGPDGALEGAVAIFRDVGEVAELAAQVRTLKDLRELAEAIIRCSEEAIAVSDEHGNYVLVNPAYSRLMGLSEEAVLHRPVTVDIRSGESVHLRVLRTRKPIRGARLQVGPQQKDVVVNAAPLLVGGRLRGSVGVIHDVSESGASPRSWPPPGSSSAASRPGTPSRTSSAPPLPWRGPRSSPGAPHERRPRCCSWGRAAPARRCSPTPSTTRATGATRRSSG